MRAIWIDNYGPPDAFVLREADDPTPGPGEVQMAVEFAGVNFGETQVRSGFRPSPNSKPPVVLGIEVGGTIREVGPDVDRAIVGGRYVARLAGSGGYVDCAVLPVASLVPVPDELPMESAVALIASGRVALQLIREAGIRKGDRVLVPAAAGAIGLLLVQLAPLFGARFVIGAARGAKKLDAIREHGADLAVDYTSPTWTDEVMRATDGEGVDIVFDSVGGDIGRAAFDLLKPGVGRFIIFGFSSSEYFQLSSYDIVMRGVRVIGVGPRNTPPPEQLKTLLAEALEFASKGSLRTKIFKTYKMSEMADAHRALEAREVIGKILVDTRQ